jgi:hypothetical protein
VRIFHVSADGAATPGETIASGDPFRSVHVTISSGHSHPVVVWTYEDAHGYAATVSAGRVSAPTSLPRPAGNVSLFSVDSGYVVLWNSNPGTAAVRLDANLNLLDAQPVVIAMASSSRASRRTVGIPF